MRKKVNCSGFFKNERAPMGGGNPPRSCCCCCFAFTFFVFDSPPLPLSGGRKEREIERESKRGKKILSSFSTRFVVFAAVLGIALPLCPSLSLSLCVCLDVRSFFGYIILSFCLYEPLFLLGHRQAAAERLALQLLLRDLLPGCSVFGARSVGSRRFLRQVPEGDVSDHQDADESQADGDDGASGGVGLDVEGGLFLKEKKERVK